jgi:putative flippase GtrA
MASLPQSLKARLLALALRQRQVLAFIFVGGVATVLHSGTVVLLVEGSLATPVPSHIAGFFLANTFSYFANSKLTFKHAPSWKRYRKFLAVSLLSLGLTIGLSGLAEAMAWHYLVGLAMVLASGPALSFVLHKTVTFRRPPPLA